jgi:diguanylate cyclase
MSTLASPSQTHQRRVRQMLWVGSGLMIFVGLGWSFFFAMHGNWVIVTVELGMAALGMVVAWLNSRRKPQAAFFVMLVVVYSAICAFGLVFDIPDAAVPRSTHHFILVLALASMLVLRDASAWLRHATVGLLLLSYVAMASTTWGISTSYLIPHDIRVTGTWINTGLAIVGLYALVHIMVTEVAESSRLELDMRRALKRQEFVLAYQAQVTSSGRVIGAEVLLRWDHPKLGRVAPGEFIDLAEQTGLILPLGSWVMRAACSQLVSWADQADMSNLTLAVNVSARQFRQQDFVAQVQAVIEETGAKPQLLKLELTESMLADNLDDIVAKMHALHALGVGCALDDFGTGYSSLSYLKRMPLDQLKIDQAFVRDVLSDAHDAAIAKTIIQLGQSLGFQVVAEGVETEGQRDFLLGIGCHVFQGYLFSKPLPLDDFATFALRNVDIPPVN